MVGDLCMVLLYIIIIVIIYLYISNKNKQIDDLNFKIKNQNLNIKDLKKEIELLNKKLLDKNIKISKLIDQITKLEKHLENYTEIKNDSLQLNAIKNEHENIEIIDFDSESSQKYDNLSQEQYEIFELMENTKNNLFITGKAGTGKSYLLKYFRSKTKKNVLYCAPTGIAALNINGVTLHSIFGWSNLTDDNFIKLNENQKKLLKNIDVLVIDEISMVRVDVFSQIDKILKVANKNNILFGGKQIILFGDLFQLPPVVRNDEKKYIESKYGGIFFFHSEAYKKGEFKFKELETIFRQTDKEFITILNNIRIGNISDYEIDLLNKHYVTEVPRRVVQVVSKKKDARQINMENLEKFNSPLYEYKAKVLIGEENIKESDFPITFNLKLKVGALVMMINNDLDKKRWVNGTLGIVSELTEKTVKITINGKEHEILPTIFNKRQCKYDETTGKLKYLIESSVSQYPLILAYAITIHKSQGMTYEQIACNLDNCFAPGQAYVALSRCANYDKLYLTKKINKSSIIIDDVVSEFYRTIKKEEK